MDQGQDGGYCVPGNVFIERGYRSQQPEQCPQAVLAHQMAASCLLGKNSHPCFRVRKPEGKSSMPSVVAQAHVVGEASA